MSPLDNLIAHVCDLQVKRPMVAHQIINRLMVDRMHGCSDITLLVQGHHSTGLEQISLMLTYERQKLSRCNVVSEEWWRVYTPILVGLLLVSCFLVQSR